MPTPKKKLTPKQRSEAAKKKAARKRKKHAAFLTNNDILHFARSHSPCGNTGAKKCNDYGNKLGSPPGSMNQAYEAAVHHILPVSAVIGFMKEYKTDEAKKKRIASVYANMDWCINKKPNLMWLPYFPAYQRHLNVEATTAGAPKNLAAHNFDHPAYNTAVVKRIKFHWKDIVNRPASTDPECKKHEDIVETLESEIGKFRPKLRTRKAAEVLSEVEKLRKQGLGMATIDAKLSQSDHPLFEWWKTFSMVPGEAIPRPNGLLFSKPPSRKLRRAIKSRVESNS